jgi:predicted nucleotidyltransferase
MRLNEYEIRTINRLTKDTFGEQAVVRLFGSRTDDRKKGGDIDLCIELPEEIASKLLILKKAEFLTNLELKIGEQKIDLIVVTENNRKMGVVQTALKEGILL